MPREFDPLVNAFEHDTHRPRATEALKSLQKIASLVKPIMRTRNWKVGTLCEFYPPETNLLGLNINRGQKICLRLRYPGDERQFLPVEQVVDTMLHELSHNVHGPHDEHFHALWNQLRDEHEALVRKGYTGEGFLSDGKRLGGSGSLPMYEAKRRARAAAEKRRTLLAGSGQKLGGAPVRRGTDIRKVIADAAQRRITVTRGCASGTDKGREIERDVQKKRPGVTMTKAEEDDANEEAIMQAFIDLIQEDEKEKYGESYMPPTESNPAGMRATMSPPPTANSPPGVSATIFPPASHLLVPPRPADKTPIAIKEENRASQRPASTKQEQKQPIIHQPPLVTPATDPDPDPDPETWTCDICTLVNPLQFLSCDACGTQRPAAASSNPFSLPSPPANPPSSAQPPSRNVKEPPNALKPRQSATASIARIQAQEASKPPKPSGWMCTRCGNWMESQWWTCARCGNMKTSS